MFPSLLQKIIARGLRAMPGSWRTRQRHQDPREMFLATVKEMEGRTYKSANKILVSTKDGFEIFVFKDDYIGQAIAQAGKFEPHVALALSERLRPGATYYDIGGNLGYLTCLGAKLVGPKGRVRVFEPNPTNVELIRASLAVNNLTNVLVHQMAVSDRMTELPFQTIGTNGSVDLNIATPHLFVPSIDLDSFLPEESVDLIKMDIEAHEPMALRGMQRIIENNRPIIICEVNPWALSKNGHDALTLLEQLAAPDYALCIIPLFGSLLPIRSAREGMEYFRSLGDEQTHFDVLAEPN
jgi:FkbM family methyltransferase